MSEHEKHKSPCYVPEELGNIRHHIEEMIHSELARNEKLVSCVTEEIERSESLGLLALNIQKFSSTYSYVLDNIVSKIFRRWPRTRFLGRNVIRLFVSQISNKFFEPSIRRTLGFAKFLGQKFNAESISVTIGAPFTVTFTITVNISP